MFKKKSLIFLFIFLNLNSEAFLPDFLILGAMKAGTTSLYEYLIKHPLIVKAKKKEIHFFDRKFHFGYDWYKQQFPEKKANQITGEATPSYLFCPGICDKIVKTGKKVKLIIILRDPVKRAFSHYTMMLKFGVENLSFEKAINLENERLKIPENELPYSYLKRGIYINQIKKWRQHFKDDQILIIFSDDLFKDPEKVVNQVFKFLNVPEFKLDKYPVYNGAKIKLTLDNDMKAKLQRYFKPYNEQLAKYLNIKLPWNY